MKWISRLMLQFWKDELRDARIRLDVTEQMKVTKMYHYENLVKARQAVAEAEDRVAKWEKRV